MAKNKDKKVPEVEENVEESVEVVEEVKAEEVLVEEKPQFKNNSKKGIKIKLIDGKKFKWITVKPGESVTIPAKIAKANNLTKVE